MKRFQCEQCNMIITHEKPALKLSPLQQDGTIVAPCPWCKELYDKRVMKTYFTYQYMLTAVDHFMREIKK